MTYTLKQTKKVIPFFALVSAILFFVSFQVAFAGMTCTSSNPGPQVCRQVPVVSVGGSNVSTYTDSGGKTFVTVTNIATGQVTTGTGFDYNGDGDIADNNEVFISGTNNSGNNTGGGTTVTDTAPLGDLHQTLGVDYKGPNTSCDAIIGWSCDRDFRDNPVMIQMYVDDKFYTSFKTSVPRPNLIAPAWAPANGYACGPSTNALWGFRYPTPLDLKDGKAHVVKIKAINQGVKGSALDVWLPNQMGKGALPIPLQCGVPGLPYNLGASIKDTGDQIEGIAFTITASAYNVGRETTKDPFILKVQLDKKTGTAATGWLYEGDGINGDRLLKTTIPAGLAPVATSSHDFTGILLPEGEYRVRAIADPNFVVEATTSRQLENNTTNWTYFTVVKGVPAPNLSFASFVLSETCTTATMSVNDTCPTTKATFTVKNSGDKAVTAGTAIPYHLEYKLPTDAVDATWRSTASANYTGGLAIGSTSPAMTAAVSNLPIGAIAIRAVVNMPAAVPVGELNFSDNTSNSVSVTYTAANTELSFRSFAITDTCETSAMVGNTPCPETTVSFVLQNAGNRNVPNGQGIPYRVEYKPDAASDWLLSSTGSFNGPLTAKTNGTSTSWYSTPISALVKNLRLGSTQLRAIVNPAPGKPVLNEIDFSNNISQTLNQSYLFDVAKVTLTSTDLVVRYGSSVTLTWSVEAEYGMRCTLSGAFNPGQTGLTFTTTPGKMTKTIPSAALRSTQTFGITCTPLVGPGIPPDVVTKSSRVEVVPLVQEI